MIQLPLYVKVCLLFACVGVLSWNLWAYFREAKRCYAEEMEAQKKTLERQRERKIDT